MSSGALSSQKSFASFYGPVQLGSPPAVYPYSCSYIINNSQNASYISLLLLSLGFADTSWTAIILGIDEEIWGTRAIIPSSGWPKTDKVWFTKIYSGGNAPAAGGMPGAGS